MWLSGISGHGAGSVSVCKVWHPHTSTRTLPPHPHTYTPTHPHTFIHTHAHTHQPLHPHHIHGCTHTHLHPHYTLTHIQEDTHTWTYTHSCTHTHTHPPLHPLSHTRKHPHLNLYTHARIYTCMHTQTHMYVGYWVMVLMAQYPSGAHYKVSRNVHCHKSDKTLHFTRT